VWLTNIRLFGAGHSCARALAFLYSVLRTRVWICEKDLAESTHRLRSSEHCRSEIASATVRTSVSDEALQERRLQSFDLAVQGLGMRVTAEERAPVERRA